MKYNRNNKGQFIRKPVTTVTQMRMAVLAKHQKAKQIHDAKNLILIFIILYTFINLFNSIF